MSANDGLMDVDFESNDGQLIEEMDERVSLRSAARQAGNSEDKRTGLFVPGDVVTEDSSFMRGHGTFVSPQGLVASVAGVVEPINRLISVKSHGSRYVGEIGDVVVGRISEVQVQLKRWKVDTNGRLNSLLLMSSINLPGGELRRKTEEDELMMRSFFQEGDLISAEVQSQFADGSLSLHTRSLKYGKLGQGLLLTVPACLIQRRKTHFHSLPCGAHVVLGNNGNVWISRPTDGQQSDCGFDPNRVPVAQRQVIVRLANCVSALALHKLLLQDTSITYAYEESLNYPVSHLLRRDVSEQLALRTRQRMMMQ